MIDNVPVEAVMENLLSHANIFKWMYEFIYNFLY